MSKSKPQSLLTDSLRQAILDSGLPLFRLANETGIARTSLIRFVRDESSIRLDIADRLAQHFGFSLIQDDVVTTDREKTKRK